MKVDLQLLVSNDSVVTKCFRCTEKNLLTLLTPTGKRYFLYADDRKLFMVFVLKCRPSHHSSQSFKLKIELSSETAKYAAEVELVTRKRRNPEGISYLKNTFINYRFSTCERRNSDYDFS